MLFRSLHGLLDGVEILLVLDVALLDVVELVLRGLEVAVAVVVEEVAQFVGPLQDVQRHFERAVLELDAKCPNEYRWIIQQCLEQGWIQPVAYVPRSDPTLMWDTLNDRTR